MFNSGEMIKGNGIFFWRVRGSDCSYYAVEDKSLRVYSEFRTGLDVLPCLLELTKGEGGFTIKFYFNEDSPARIFNREEKKEVTDCFVKEILNGTTLGSKWEKRVIEEGKRDPKKRKECRQEVEKHGEDRKKLEQILRQKVEAFVG
ncbi:MAG: hypothetical protein V3574_00985 [Candidatus Moraniibacteriota bacterium]